jgi:hypothetical protein
MNLHVVDDFYLDVAAAGRAHSERSSLPILLLALPAGPLANVVDRRRLFTCFSRTDGRRLALSWLTIFYLATPILLLTDVCNWCGLYTECRSVAGDDFGANAAR